MSSGVKTLLVVGGAAVGTFVVLKLLAPSPAVVRASLDRTTPISIAGIGGFFSGVASLFSGSSNSNTLPPTDSRYEAIYANEHGVLDVQGNQLIDLNTGRPVVYDVY